MTAFKHYEGTFKSQFNTLFKAEIWNRTTAPAAVSEISFGKPGFSISWKKLNDPFTGGIQASNCVLKFMVHDATELTAAHDILNANNNTWFLKIFKGTNLFWFGWVQSGFDGYPDRSFPYIVDIKATDSLGTPLNKYNNQVDVSSQADYKELLQPLGLFDTNYDIASMGGGPRYAMQTNWFNLATGTTPPTNTNPLRKTYYNRAAFVSDPETYPLTIEDFNTEFTGVLKPFMLRVLQSKGFYFVQQPAFLDATNPEPIITNAPSIGGTDLFPGDSGYSFYAPGVNEVTIDNNTPPTTANKGVIQSGARFSLRQEANSVRSTYIYGNNFASIPINLDYTAGLVSLGYMSQGVGNLTLILNTELRQKFNLTGAGAVTPCANQGLYMTGRLELKIKVGNKYLKQVSGSSAQYEFEWTTVNSSIYIFTGSGTAYDNELGGGVTTNQENVQQALGLTGGAYPLPFTSWIENDPVTNEAIATARFYMAGVTLPDLGASYGVLQMQIVAGNIYYWTPNTPPGNAYIFDDWTTWITESNPAASTNLNFNTSTSTFAQPVSQTISNGVVPYTSDILISEELGIDDDTPPIGSTFFASQATDTNGPDINLGDLMLGASASNNQLNTLRAKDAAGDYISTGGFRAGTTGAFSNPTQLLVTEYLKTRENSIVMLEGVIISTSYEAHKTIVYSDEIGGTTARYIFGGGRFNPNEESWSGSWIKLDLSTSTPTITEDTIYTPPDSTNPGGHGTGPVILGDAPYKEPKHIFPTTTTPEKLDMKQKLLLNNNLVGIISENVVNGVLINKVDTNPLICKVYDNQRLYLLDTQFRAVTELTVNGTQAKGATQLNFDNITPDISYLTGCYIMLIGNDLTNVITAGTATPNLFLGVTTTKIHIKPDQFKTWNSDSIQSYSRDLLGSVQPSAYATRTKVYASTFVPLGYKVIEFNIYSSQNRTMQAFTSRTISDNTTLRGTGTANTLQLMTAWPSVEGDYFILTYEIGASTDEIYGAVLTIALI
jgi:hypothetical protein|tara:strand:- start:526 stop:3534 length:3009 start_codon:yes stop_codon:yes gene_type:complete